MKAEVIVRKRSGTHANGTDRFFQVIKLDGSGRRTSQRFLISDIDEPEPDLLEAYDAIGVDEATFVVDVPDWFFGRRDHWSVDKQRQHQYDTLLSLLEQRAWGKGRLTHPMTARASDHRVAIEARDLSAPTCIRWTPCNGPAETGQSVAIASGRISPVSIS